VVVPKEKEIELYFFCFLEKLQAVEPNVNIKIHIHYFLSLLTSCTSFNLFLYNGVSGCWNPWM